MSKGGSNREGIFDFLWDTDTEIGRDLSNEMERAYLNDEIAWGRTEVELQSEPIRERRSEINV